MVLDNLAKTATSPEANIPLPRTTLERMRQSGNRQLALINSLLESHVNDVHGIAINPQPIAIAKVIQNAIDDLQPLLENEEAEIDLQIRSELSPALVDAALVCRVFQNLITNALKHNPPHLKLTISVESSDSKTMLCKVSDNGVGMSSTQSEHLFELYAQGKT